MLTISKALYKEGWISSSWTLPLVWPLFFVDLPLGTAPIFRGPFPWYGPYFCVIKLSFDAFFRFQKLKSIVSEFSIKSEIRGFYYISIDEEAVESNNMV